MSASRRAGRGGLFRPCGAVPPSGAVPGIRTEGTRVGSVYVHAPFCVRRCVYCDFAVEVRRSGGGREWIEALERELALVRREERFVLAQGLDTLYVGGGTPSLLGPEAMAALGEVLGRDRVEATELEWTAEANPESFTPRVATAWRSAGVNRVSLGVQTFHAPSLRWMGRLHGPDGALRSVRTAREAGFHEVGVDLILGLPERLGRPWAEDLERVVDLGVPHVSVYGLTVEPRTPLGRAVAAGRESVAGEERYREEYLEAAERLTGAGWIHYEVSNFARPGHECRHNDAYWSGLPYLGLGNGSHSYAHPLRRWNLRSWGEYQEAVLRGLLPLGGEEVLNTDQQRLEGVWLALRTRRGLLRSGLRDEAGELVSGWEARGWASVVDGSVRLTAEGWLVMDRLAVELDSRFG